MNIQQLNAKHVTARAHVKLESARHVAVTERIIQSTEEIGLTEMKRDIRKENAAIEAHNRDKRRVKWCVTFPERRCDQCGGCAYDPYARIQTGEEK
jgi:hypothetical protein